MWSKNTKGELVAGIAAAQRVSDLLDSAVGEDIRQILVNVAQKWLGEVRKGDPHAYAGLKALDDVAAAFDLVITIGQSMQAELVRRQGGENANGRNAQSASN